MTPPPLGARARVQGGVRAALFALMCAGIFASCYPNAGDITTGEMILGLEDAMIDLRTETAILQEQIDSLVAITARQDSLIRRLADHTGMPIPR